SPPLCRRARMESSCPQRSAGPYSSTSAEESRQRFGLSLRIAKLHDRYEEMRTGARPGMDAMGAGIHRIFVAHVEKRLGIGVDVAPLDPQPQHVARLEARSRRQDLYLRFH